MIVAEYINAETGIRSVVILAADGLSFDVAAFDIDADKMIATKCFANEAAAAEYAAKFVSDVVGPGVFVPI